MTPEEQRAAYRAKLNKQKERNEQTNVWLADLRKWIQANYPDAITATIPLGPLPSSKLAAFGYEGDTEEPASPAPYWQSGSTIDGDGG